MIHHSRETASEPMPPEGQAAATKLKILAAAEEVMATRGFASSSISEIARRANVTDSAIYLYFKGKQDLLFSVPGEKLKRQLALLIEHLNGIPDPLGQLRKLIWLQLSYHDAHREYARLLTMECRSSEAFYTSPAYGTVREYARLVSSILDRGVKAKTFRADVPLRLIRDVVLGTLDMETISALATGEPESGESDFEAVVDLVDAMVEPGAREAARPTRMEAIFEAAKKVFAEKDFSKAKISEIARLAGVADGTIYEYFQSKEDILLSLAANRLESYIEQAAGAFDVKNPERKLRRLIKHHFSCFLKDREFLKLFLLRVQTNDRFYSSNAFELFRNYGALIEDVVEEGKAQAVFRPTVNSRVFRNMFFGAFVHMAIRWFVLRDSARVDKLEEIEQVTELLTAAVLVRASDRADSATRSVSTRSREVAKG